MCDNVLVLEGGAVVEHGEADTVFTNPRHPYTKKLLNSLPQLV
ncbi:oligopeptide/dipeptide ABC transporter ATP-binding protein [Rhodococcus jostii]